MARTFAGDADPSAAASLLTKATSAASAGLMMLGPAGAFAAGALKTAGASAEALGSLADGLSQRAKKLENFSPEIAGAEARADVRELLREIREAQQLGGKYAEMIEAKENFKDTISDAFMPIKEFLLKVVTDTLPVLAEIVKMFADAVVSFINWMIRRANTVRRLFGKDELEEIVAGGMRRHDLAQGAEKMVSDFLNKLVHQRNLDPRDYRPPRPAERPLIPGGPVIPGL